MIPRFTCALFTLSLLAACGGGSGGTSTPPSGKPVVVEGFETYETGHNQRQRVKLTSTQAQAGDAAVLAKIDTGKGPAGYKDLVAIHNNQMTIEVIAEVGQPGQPDKAKRILRLTADQIPLNNVKNGKVVEATGTYYFRGQSFAWVTIDDGPLLSGTHAQGLETLAIDFSAGTAAINLRTEVGSASDVEINLVANNLPFNIVTGAFGGDTTISVRDPNIDKVYAVDGALRGTIGGTPGYANGQHNLSASGLFHGNSDKVTVEGAFFGTDPNAK